MLEKHGCDWKVATWIPDQQDHFGWGKWKSSDCSSLITTEVHLSKALNPPTAPVELREGVVNCLELCVNTAFQKVSLN